MFFPPTGPFDPEAAAEGCQAQWGVKPDSFWASKTYGGLQGLQKQLRNVVFSNGLLDPWSAGGILDPRGFHPSVKTVIIPNGAHHIDLMFSHRLDTKDIKEARRVELEEISKWIEFASKRQRPTAFAEQM